MMATSVAAPVALAGPAATARPPTVWATAAMVVSAATETRPPTAAVMAATAVRAVPAATVGC